MDKDIDSLSSDVFNKFTMVFGETPLNKRLDDILDKAIKMREFSSLNGLEKNTGELLASLMALYGESYSSPYSSLASTMESIDRRKDQYSSVGRKNRVALLGGAFDPIHNGHIAMGELALEAAHMDEVWYMPCYDHRFGKKMAVSKDRMAMIATAIAHNPRLKLFDFEVKNEMGGELLHTVNKLKEAPYSDSCEFYFIMGQDNADSINKWYEHEHLLRSINFIVIGRNGDPVSNNAWYRSRPHIFLANEDEKISHISSTQVRENIARGHLMSASNLVPISVLKFIETHKLYRGDKK